MSRASDPVDLLHAAIREGIEPLAALARFRVAQARFHEVYAKSNPVSCQRGCSACCSQLVFDVIAVEVEDLGRHLRRTGRDVEVLDGLEAGDLVAETHPDGG